MNNTENIEISKTFLITGIILSVLFAPFALQRVLIPELGRLKVVFIIDAIIATFAVINFIATMTFSLSLMKVCSIIVALSTIALCIVTLIDIVKMYKMSRVKI